MSLKPRSRVLAALMTLFAAACGGSGVLTGPSAIVGGAWKLQSLETSSGLVSISRPDNFTIVFGEAGSLGIKADCNVCGGSYSISGDSLSTSGIFCTLAYCGDASNDRAFMAVLTSAKSHGVRGVELSIESPNGTARLTR